MTAQEDLSGYSYTVLGNYEYEGILYSYGYVTGEFLVESDGYLQVKSEEETITVMFDSGMSEHAVFMAVLEKNIAVVYERYMVNDETGIIFCGISIVTYSANGNVQGRLDYRDIPVCYGNRNFLLLVKWANEKVDIINSYLSLCYEKDVAGTYENTFNYQYQGTAQVNGTYVESIDISTPGNYDIIIEDDIGIKEFNIVVDPLVEGIENGKLYTDEVTIFAKGDLYLDDTTFLSGSTVSIAGIHELTIVGEGGYEKNYLFSIAIRLENVYDGMETSEGIRIFANTTELVINGEIYEGGIISKAGSYVLVASGVGGMEETVSFSILPALFGADNGAIYTDSVEIWTNCDFLMNGEMESEHCIVDEAGKYEVILMMEGSEYSRLTFSIEKDKNTFGFLISPIFWTSVMAFIAVTGLVIIYKKK